MLTTEERIAVKDGFVSSWNDLRTLEEFVNWLRVHPQRFAARWDASIARIRLRQSLIMGETVEFFTPNGPTKADDYLHGELTAKKISQVIDYPTKHVYRLLESEGRFVRRVSNRYRRGIRRGPFNEYKFLATEKASEPVRYYTQTVAELAEHPQAARVLMERLLRSGYFQRGMRCHFEFQCSIVDALGHDRIFDFVKMHFPPRYRQKFELQRGEVIEGLRKTVALWRDEGTRKRMIDIAMAEVKDDPWLGLQRWVEISKPAEKSEKELPPRGAEPQRCGRCGLTLETPDAMRNHLSRAHPDFRDRNNNTRNRAPIS